jgi:hypothetical protein
VSHGGAVRISGEVSAIKLALVLLGTKQGMSRSTGEKESQDRLLFIGKLVNP